jgi:adenine/guanine phosphoribosyltransferase-like PRPP-binding protein
LIQFLGELSGHGRRTHPFRGLSSAGLIILAALVAGCATDVANRYYGTETYSPKDPKFVELLWKSPAREFVVIADFQARGESPEGMRKRAAKIGADAVIVSILGGNYSRSEEWAGQDREANTYNRITGTAIKYK